MKIIVLLFLCVSIIPPDAYSQTNVNRGGFNTVQYLVNQRNNQNKDQGDISKEILNKATGSPYEKEEFKFGKIFTEDKETSMAALLRYNILYDEIEIKNEEGGQINIVHKDPNIMVSIGVDRYIYSTDHNGYFKVLNNTKPYRLYKKAKVKFIEGTEAETIYNIAKKPNFSKTEIYYLTDKNNSFLELPKNKSKIYKMIPGNEKALKKFVKDNKLNLKTEKDLTKLVDYFNEI